MILYVVSVHRGPTDSVFRPSESAPLMGDDGLMRSFPSLERGEVSEVHLKYTCDDREDGSIE